MEVRTGPPQRGPQAGAAAIAVDDRRAAVVPATPFRGIHSFRTVDHAIFFARESETEELLDLVTVYRGAMLYGESSTGKSSLVNAGLVPAAAELGLHVERVRVQPRRGEELVLERIQAGLDATVPMPSLLADQDDDASRAVFSPDAFAQRVEAACAHGRPLLVFDQFEELATLFDEAGAEQARQRVVDLLVELIHGDLPVKVLLVFREDYLGRVKQLLADCPDLVDQALRLAPPTQAALATIIRGPFERNPGCFERELSPSLAARLRDLLGERFGSGEVSLTEVQTVCLRLWQSEDPDALLERRGVRGLLEDYLGEALKQLTPDLRTAAVALLAQMVTTAKTRNVISAPDLLDRVPRKEGIPRKDLERALEQLATSRLVRRERRRNVDLYEITSEFLVPWISEQRERQRRLRERRRLIALAALTATGLAIAAIVGVLALWALSQRDAARRSATSATALGLSVAAQQRLHDRLDAALLLGLDAYETSPRFATWSTLVGAIESARASGAEAVMHGHSDFVRSVAFSPDGRTLASAGNDGTVRLWSPSTHRQVGLLAPARRAVIAAIAYSPDGRLLATGGEGGQVRLWDVADRRLDAHQMPPQAHDVTSVAFSRDGSKLATGSVDGSAQIWDLVHRTPRGRPFGHVTKGILSVSFSRDGGRLATGGGDGSVRMWSVDYGYELGPRMLGHTGPVRTVLFSPDGRTIASGADDSTVQLWAAETHAPIGGSISRYSGDVGSLAFSPDGNEIVFGTAGGPVQLYDIAKGDFDGSAMEGHTGPVMGVAFSPDGSTVASGGRDETVRLWRVAPRNYFANSLVGHKDAVLSVAFGRDGRTIASGGLDQTVRLWDGSRQRERGYPLTDGEGRVAAVALDRGGHLLASGDTEDRVRLWNVATQSELQPALTGHSGDITSVAFSPDARLVAAGAYDGTVRLWDVRTHAPAGPVLRGLGDVVRSVAFSPDGRILAAGGSDDTAQLWDTRSWRPLGGPLAGHTDDVTSVAFSTDGRTLATGSADDTIRLWRVATRRQLGSALVGDTAPVTGVAFSPDDDTLASSSYDGTVRLWDMTTRRQIGQPLDVEGTGLSSVAFGPGHSVVAGGLDGDLWLWANVYWRSGATLRGIVCHVVGSDFSRREWALFAPGIDYRRGCTATG